MSDAHNEHETPIKTPKQLIVAILAAFIVPIIIIVLLVIYANNGMRSGADSAAMSAQSIEKRIAPVAQVDVRDVNAPRVYKTGEQVFKDVCMACHATGAAGAPKFGTDEWEHHIAKGFNTMVKNALAGIGAMPPRGGTNPDDYSDFEIERAIVYMANGSGGHFPEPVAPAPVTGASSAATASPEQKSK